MKKALIALGLLLFLSSSVNAGQQCPDIKEIEAHLADFKVREGRTHLDKNSWKFASTLSDSLKVNSIQRLNEEMSPEGACMYTLFLPEPAAPASLVLILIR